MTAREKIANLLWWSVPSTDTADAKAKTEQMLDEHRIENRVEAADWLTDYPFPAASTDWERGRDAGVAWAASVLRIPHPRRPDVAAPADEAVPLVVSRFDTAMEPAPEEEQVLTIGCIAEDGRPVALLLDVEDRRKVAGWVGPVSDETDGDKDFFQPGRTYAREHHGRTIEFLVRSVDSPPDGSWRIARGWRLDEDGDWEPTDSDDLTGWTDVTEKGAS